MTAGSLPANFDWVTERHNCSVEAFFDRLWMAAKENVGTRNALARAGAGRFAAQQAAGNAFSVLWAYGDGKGNVAKVTFSTDGTAISAAGMGVDVQFTGHLTLNDQAQCRLNVGGVDLDEWQVLRRALEDLFFHAPQRLT